VILSPLVFPELGDGWEQSTFSQMTFNQMTLCRVKTAATNRGEFFAAFVESFDELFKELIDSLGSHHVRLAWFRRS